MSFSTLDGIPMATRCGNIDAGVLLHLLSRQNMSADEVTDMLYHRSGLLGVSASVVIAETCWQVMHLRRSKRLIFSPPVLPVKSLDSDQPWRGGCRYFYRRHW
ncbi:Acetate kinase [Brucella anthropi]|nr:Acetate kinase [Brucella anthropi]